MLPDSSHGGGSLDRLHVGRYRLGQATCWFRNWRQGQANREDALRSRVDPFRARSFRLSQTNRRAGAELATVTCGLGVLYWRRLYRGGRGDNYRDSRTAGGGARRPTNRNFHTASLATDSGDWRQRVSMER